MSQPNSTARALAVLLAVVLLSAGAVACGDDDGENSGAKTASAETDTVERAFLTGMVPHHEAAVEMAEIAEQKGQDPFIKELAAEITTTQQREIGQMRRIHMRLFTSTLRPDSRAHEGLGLSAKQAGMKHSETTNMILQAADPFDRSFVDEMVPHHEGAIRMADVVLDSTEDPALRSLADSIIRTQRTEVKAMNAFRTKKYGGPVPSGGSEAPVEEEHGAGH